MENPINIISKKIKSNIPTLDFKSFKNSNDFPDLINFFKNDKFTEDDLENNNIDEVIIINKIHLSNYKKLLTDTEYNNMVKQDNTLKDNLELIKECINEATESKEKAENVLNEYNTRYQELKSGADLLYNENVSVLNESYNLGGISKEEYNRRLKEYENAKLETYILCNKYFEKILNDNPDLKIDGLKTYDDYKKFAQDQNNIILELSNTKYNLEQVKKMLPDVFIMDSAAFKETETKLPFNLDISYEEFMGIQALVRDADVRESAGEINAFLNLKNKYGINSLKDFELMKNLYFMDNNSRKLYQYYKDSGDDELAINLLNVMKDSINNTQGAKQAELFLKYLKEGSIEFSNGELMIHDSAITNTLKTFGYGTGDGILTFFEGIENFIYSDGIRSDSDYRRMYIMQALSQNDEWKHYLPTVYQFSNSFGNMIPSIAASAAVSVIGSPILGSEFAYSLGPKIGSTLMGLSAAGNVTEESVQQGRDKMPSIIYGAFSGLSEATLGYFLGKTPFISESSGLTLANLWSEAAEEGSQEIVSAMLEGVIFKDYIDLDTLKDNTVHSAAMGFAMALFLNGTGQIKTNIQGNMYLLTDASFVNIMDSLSPNASYENLVNEIQNKARLIDGVDDATQVLEIVNDSLNPVVLETNDSIKNKYKIPTQEDGSILFYHGGLNEEFDFNTLDVFRNAEKQQKKGRDYAGFYMYDENYLNGAFRYAEQENSRKGTDDKGVFEIKIDSNAKIYDAETSITRFTKEQLQDLKNQGYDLIVGKPPIGGNEYVLLNTDKIVDTKFLGTKDSYELKLAQSKIEEDIKNTFNNINPNSNINATQQAMDAIARMSISSDSKIANQLDNIDTINNKTISDKYDENGHLKVFNKIKDNLLHTDQEKINLGDNTNAVEFVVNTFEEIYKKSNNSSIKIVQNFDVIKKINPGFKVFESTETGNGFMKNLNALVVNFNESIDFYGESHEIGHVILKNMDNTTVPNNFDNVLENMKNNTKSIDSSSLKIGEDIIEEPTFGKILLAIADPKNANIEGVGAVSDIISSAFQTIGWENVRGQRVILPYSHPKEYYTTIDSEGVVTPKLDTIYDEQFANFFALYSNNNTEMLNVLKNLFGNEWYNLMESKVNEIAKSMEQANRNYNEK